jgi:hypothetical protein
MQPNCTLASMDFGCHRRKSDFIARPTGEIEDVVRRHALRFFSEIIGFGGEMSLTDLEGYILDQDDETAPVDLEIWRLDGYTVVEWRCGDTVGRWVELRLGAPQSRTTRCRIRWETGTTNGSWFIGRALGRAGLARIDASETSKISGVSRETEDKLLAAVVR